MDDSINIKGYTMKILKFIKALKKAKHWKEGSITFWYNGEVIEIEYMGQSNFDLTEVNITFKKPTTYENIKSLDINKLAKILCNKKVCQSMAEGRRLVMTAKKEI